MVSKNTHLVTFYEDNILFVLRSHNIRCYRVQIKNKLILARVNELELAVAAQCRGGEMPAAVDAPSQEPDHLPVARKSAPPRKAH